MKVIFITNIYKKEEKRELERVSLEIRKLGFEDYEIFAHDGIKNNQGYAYGVNQGIKKGLKKGGEIFIVFNVDISLTKLTKQSIIDGLKRFDILGFACEQDNTFYYGGQIDKWRMSGGMIKKKPISRYSLVDFVSGSLMFIKKEVISKIGLFDESYFFYYEETDFCYLAKKNNFQVGIDSQNRYVHYELSKTNPRKEYFLAKNRLKFFLKYSSFKQKLYELIRLPKTLFEYLPMVKSIVFRSSFLTDFFSLNFSSILNKFFHFGLFIFLVRNLLPAQYGTYTLVWAFIAIFNPFVDLGTTSYGLIYLPRQKNLLINRLVSMRFFVALLIFVLINILSWFTFKTQPVVAIFVFLTSVTILSNVWSGTYLIINSIKEKVFRSSLVSLVFNLFFVLAILFFYLIRKNLSSIFLAIFFCYTIYLLINFYLVKKELKKIKLSFELSAWVKIFKKSYIFVLISFFAGLYFKLDVFLLKFLKSEVEVGIYSSGYKFLDALVLIAGTYNIVVMPIISRLVADKNALKIKIKKDVFLLSSIAIPTVIIFFIFAPWILPIILKGSYLAGVNIARTVIFALPFIFLSSIFYNVLYGLGMAPYVLVILIVQTVVNLILNLIFIPKFSIWAAAYITIICEGLNTFLAYYFVQKKLKSI